MEEFLEDFMNIQTILNKPSGLHMIESENIDTWIAKMNPTIQPYGHMFKDNIRYIKWSELLINMEVALHKAAELKNKDKESIWLTIPGKSYHIFALIAYHYCTLNPKLSVLLPTKILNMSSNYDIGKSIANVDYYIFDDIAYSGTQAESNKYAIFDWCEGLPSVELYLVNCYVTKKAYQLIKPLTGTEFFRCHLIYGVMLESLTERIGELNSSILQILFGPGVRSDCIIYADHKMADFSSTFMMTLQYGLVPPDTLDYTTIIEIVNRFIDTEPYVLAMKHLMSEGITICAKHKLRKWTYYPFINGCRKSMSPTLLSYPYEIILNLPALLYSHENEWLDEDLKEQYKDYDYEEFKLIVNNRCPVKWY